MDIYFGDLHSCLVVKYKPFGKKKLPRLKKKKPWTLQRQIWKYNNYFDLFFKYRPKHSPQKIWTINVYYFMIKLLSHLVLDLRKRPNRNMPESESACFPVGALCKFQNWIRKQFSLKVLYNYCSKFFFLSAFQSIFKKCLKKISLYFLILRERVLLIFFFKLGS